jgi:hypothetical protein
VRTWNVCLHVNKDSDWLVACKQSEYHLLAATTATTTATTITIQPCHGSHVERQRIIASVDASNDETKKKTDELSLLSSFRTLLDGVVD